MIREIKIVLLGLLAVAVAACSKETSPRGTEAVDITIAPTIAQGSWGDGSLGLSDNAGENAGETRAKVVGETATPTRFPAGTKVGFGIAAPTAEEPLPDYYKNMRAETDGALWTFYPNEINTGHRLSGFASWNWVYVYGYCPYNPAVTDTSAIPFVIANPIVGDPDGVEAEGTETDALTDYMAAGTTDKSMTLGSPALEPVFQHLMTSIEIILRRAYVHYAPIKLESVTYEIIDEPGSDRYFVVSGSYNAQLPTVNPKLGEPGSSITAGNKVKKMRIAYPTTMPYFSTVGVTVYDLVIMPELRQNAAAGNGDAKVRLTFRFLDQDGVHYEFENAAGGDPSVEFLLSAVTNGADDKGLLAGYTYTITAQPGTYTHFEAPTSGTYTVVKDAPITDPTEDKDNYGEV